MIRSDFERFVGPADHFVLEDWQGAEIYDGEDYLEFNGAIILNETENILEYVREHATKRTAEGKTK